MADGIQINDAALEISPEGLDALIKQQGTDIRLTKIDLTVSPDALNTLLRGLAPEGQPAPTAQVGEGRVQLSGEKDGKKLALDLDLGGLRLEIAPDGVRLVSGTDAGDQHP